MNWNRVDLIDLVEAYAADNGAIADESELSALFDEEIAPLVVEKYGESDTCAMDEAFNDWTDGLCKDGVIHPEQYNTYTYVGKYSN